MKELILKGGRLISPQIGLSGVKKDIRIKDGVIVEIADDIASDVNVLDVTGKYVSPGFIDIHTHVYPKADLGVDPDIVGITRGSTTVFDAGSSGAENFEDFKTNYIDKSKTKVISLLNVSKKGLLVAHELNEESNIDEQKLIEVVSKYPKDIRGLKARASGSVVGKLGFEPIRRAANIAHKVKLPLMVHVGNRPPKLEDVLNVLTKGDVVTHGFNGKEFGLIRDGDVISEAKAARERGVLFDVGHGEASFNFNVYKKALSLGFDCDNISTDIHSRNYDGNVKSLSYIASKVIACGEPFMDAISKITEEPANIFNLKDRGYLKEGYLADINIFTFEKCNEPIKDADGNEENLKEKICLDKTIYEYRGEIEIYEHNRWLF